MNELLENTFNFVLSEWYYTSAFFFVFFSILYFVGTFITEIIVDYKTKNKTLRQIVFAKKPGQRSKEIRNSLVSILVFSLQAILFQILFSQGIFKVRFDNPWNCLWEIPLLFFWNELHFYMVHWLLHRRWFFLNVHKVHHWSKEPTAYSIFSFHWIEAFLLGTVIFFPLFIHDFQVYSILSLPIMSLVINLLGHCNHEIPSDKPNSSFSKYTFRHSMHHKWGHGNFGFMLSIFDKIFKTQVSENKN